MAEKMDIALTPTREGKTIKRSGSIGENSTREIDGYSQPKKIRRSSDNRHSLLNVIINSYSVFVSYTSSRLYIVVEVLSCLFLSKYSRVGLKSNFWVDIYMIDEKYPGYNMPKSI